MCGFVVPVGSSSLIVMGDTVIHGRAIESQCCIGGVCGPGLCSSCLIGIGVALRRVTLLVLAGLYMSFIVAAILQSGGIMEYAVTSPARCCDLRAAVCPSAHLFLSSFPCARGRHGSLTFFALV